MFKVFRIKDEHSAFLNDGGGIGSRGLASVRLYHASLFLLSPTVCLSLSPGSSSLLLPPSTCLQCLTLSLSPASAFLSTCSLCHSSWLSLSCFLNPCCISSLIHPSPLPLTVIIYPVSFMQLSPSLLHSLPQPVPLSLTHLSHCPWRPIRLMAMLIGCGSFKRGMT